jgi:bifunctional UDP-N-acetylglucosamine pyrophosphorylase/glucosamine-1-phosphate N-acetyltransferase
MPETIGIILAAGKGTRMKSKLPKALHSICGKALTRWVIDACKEGGISECIVVIGHGAEQVEAELGSDVRYGIQEEQLGTGDACKVATELLGDRDVNVVVLPGDAPIITADDLRSLCEAHAASEASATLLTAILDDAGHYGRVIRGDDGYVQCIVEAKDATPDQLNVQEMNAAMYCFKLPALRKYISRLTPANAQGELYLTDVIGMMVADGLKVGAKVADDPNITLAVNNRVELAGLTEVIQRRILEKLMLGGATIIDPDSTYVTYDVQIGMDTIVHPGCVLESGTIIGQDCVIGPCARITASQIGNGVTVTYSSVRQSEIGDGTWVGPYANIRPGCKIGQKVKIGDFVEAKNSEIEDGAAMGHLSYIGDATVGEKTNIGAGTITCNYDGYAKHRTTIGKRVFVGSHTTFVAPVKVGDGALTAAGSVVTEDVPSDALVIGRSMPVVKQDWAKRRREEKES